MALIQSGRAPFGMEELEWVRIFDPGASCLALLSDL